MQILTFLRHLSTYFIFKVTSLKIQTEKPYNILATSASNVFQSIKYEFK